jgi:hypothetical protein
MRSAAVAIVTLTAPAMCQHVAHTEQVVCRFDVLLSIAGALPG